MRKLDPIAAPTAFINSTPINRTKTEVKAIFSNISSDLSLTAKRDYPKFPKDKDYWGTYKNDLAKGQYDRCAYCELDVIGSSYGDVEHYRPKGAITTLNPKREKQGEEKESNLSNVVGRDFQEGCNTAYWLLAYDWNNYLFSCGICNQPWKRDLFPVANNTNTAARPKPGCEMEEDALLINPFLVDPADHLAFDELGNVRSKTPQGTATIETLGLWRGSLVRKRKERLQTVKLNVIAFLHELDQENAYIPYLLTSAQTILNLGSHKAIAFPGVVRNYFERKAQMKWEDLESRVERLKEACKDAYPWLIEALEETIREVDEDFRQRRRNLET